MESVALCEEGMDIMAKLAVKEIQERVLQILGRKPEGVRYVKLGNMILKRDPETKKGTIWSSIRDLYKQKKIEKLGRGLYAVTGARTTGQERRASVTAESQPGRSQEKAYYRPFADYLKNDLKEVNYVEVLGGSGLGLKWGTPDVVGVQKPGSALIRIDLAKEIVSAEIKVYCRDANLMEAVGQSVAYRLFSNKVYIGIATQKSPENSDSLLRLEKACLLLGFGLVLMPSARKSEFRIRVRAQRFSPDMFYVNDFADRLHRHSKEIFEKLFPS